jgi:uncharacterized protein YqeY
MSTSEQLTEDMKASMIAGTSDVTGTLRLLRSSIKNDEIKVGHSLEESDVLKVLQREAKQRRDSIDQYTAANRPELAAIEQSELEIIQSYLPTALSNDELESVVNAVIARLEATDTKQLGAVIGAVMKEVGATAEGGAVSALVRAKLVG